MVYSKDAATLLELKPFLSAASKRLLRMMYPIINTKTMNVELTNDRISLITQKLSPLSRLVPSSEKVVFDVVIRKMRKPWQGERYCVSVRMSTTSDKYYAIANEAYLEKTFSRVREDLRKAISKTYQAEEAKLSKMQRFVRERQYLELFA